MSPRPSAMQITRRLNFLSENVIKKHDKTFETNALYNIEHFWKSAKTTYPFNGKTARQWLLRWFS